MISNKINNCVVYSNQTKMSQIRSRNRGLELGVVLLFSELFNVGYNKIPPVTLFTIVGQVS